MESSSNPFRPEVLLAHREWVERAARALVHGDAEADDLQQEAWLGVLERPPARAPASPRGWLGQVLRFTAIDAVRRSEVRRRHERAASRPERVTNTPAHLVERAETMNLVAATVLALDEPYRTTVLLRYFEGLEARAIAELQGVPVETVRTRLKRGLSRLREALDPGPEGKRRGGVAALLPWIRNSPDGWWGISTGSAAGRAAGVLLMATKTKAALVLGIVVLAVAFATIRSRRGGNPPRTASTSSIESPAAPRGAPAVEPDPEVVPAPSASGAGEAVATPARVARGRVVDVEGHPVPGARVVSIPDDLSAPLVADSVSGEDGPGRVCIADASGAFTVVLAGTAPFHGLQADAGGYGPTTRTGVRPGDEVEMVLERSGALSGTVTDLHGDPVAGAGIRLSVLLGPARWMGETATNADGSFRIPAMPTASGLYTLEVVAEGLATDLRILHEIAPPGGEARCDVTLHPWGVLRGRVVDGRDGGPVPDARVVLCATPVGNGAGWVASTGSGGRRSENPDAWSALGEARTGVDGSFRMERLPGGGSGNSPTVYAGALRDGWTSTLRRLAPGEQDRDVEVELVLWPAAVLEGRVLEGDAPARGVAVRASLPGAETAAWFPAIYDGVPIPWGTTDELGRYRLPGVPVGGGGGARVTVMAYPGSLRFQAGGEARPGATVEVEAAAGDVVAVPDLVMPEFRAREAILRVVDGEGRPVGGAEFVAPGCGLNPRTGSDGTARLLWPPGDGDAVPRPVIVRARGHGPVALTVVPDERNPPTVRVVLGEGRVLSGRIEGIAPGEGDLVSVLVANGNLAPGEAFRGALDVVGKETVPTFPPLRVYAHVRADANGRFRIEDLPEGPYLVKAVMYLPGDPTAGIPPGTRESPILAAGSAAGEYTLVMPEDEAPR